MLGSYVDSVLPGGYSLEVLILPFLDRMVSGQDDGFASQSVNQSVSQSINDQIPLRISSTKSNKFNRPNPSSYKCSITPYTTGTSSSAPRRGPEGQWKFGKESGK